MIRRYHHKLHIGTTNNTLIQFYRYFLVGGMAFIVDFSLLFLLTNYLGLYYVLSAAISFTIGSVVNYLLSTRWIFPVKKYENKTLEFSLFVGIGCIGLILNSLIIYLLTDFAHFYYLVSKLFSAAIVLFWNFGARKVFLFSRGYSDVSN